MELSKEFLDKIINVTSKAAIACYPYIGKKDKILADKAATDEMRNHLNKLNINGEVVTIYGGECLKGAGQFNNLDKVTDEMWDFFSMMRKKK